MINLSFENNMAYMKVKHMADYKSHPQISS